MQAWYIQAVTWPASMAGLRLLPSIHHDVGAQHTPLPGQQVDLHLTAAGAKGAVHQLLLTCHATCHIQLQHSLLLLIHVVRGSVAAALVAPFCVTAGLVTGTVVLAICMSSATMLDDEMNTGSTGM